ncbi:MAG: DsrE family protein [Chloroflexi bacterium]|nr:DsrE family protein [Chloroflexota bacterium]
MAKLLFVGTYGIDNPTHATFPFVAVSGAIDAGHQVALVLTGDATLLIRDSLAKTVQGVGMPPLQGLLEKAVKNSVPIYL